MQDEEWIKTLEDGRIVKFIYQELLGMGCLSARSLLAMKSSIRSY
jgi:hypothetical protein